jgi:hypothetical protein
MLEVAILNGDRKHVLCYAAYLARERYKEGIGMVELSSALQHTASLTEETLQKAPALAGLTQRIHDEIGITMQLILDEIEEVYQRIHEGQDGQGETLSC